MKPAALAGLVAGVFAAGFGAALLLTGGPPAPAVGSGPGALPGGATPPPAVQFGAESGPDAAPAAGDSNAPAQAESPERGTSNAGADGAVIEAPPPPPPPIPAEALAEATRGRATSLNFDGEEGSVRSDDSGPAAANHFRVPTFEAMTKYAGHRNGRVFKLGAIGMGYYADNGGVAQLNLAGALFPMMEAPPVPVALEELVCRSSTDGRCQREAPASTTPKVRRRTWAKRKAVRCYEASLQEDDACWPDDGSRRLLSNSHRIKGMYAIDTLNPNAWPAAEEYCSCTTADFVCVQETNIDEPARDEVENAQRYKNWPMSISACGVGDKGGRSAGDAVGTSSHVGMRKFIVIDLPSDCTDHRLNITWMGAALTGVFHLGSLYLHSKIGITADANVTLLHAIGGRLTMLQVPWVLAADFAALRRNWLLRAS